MLLHPRNRPVSRLANPGWLQYFAESPATSNPDGEKGETTRTKVSIGGGKGTEPPAPAPKSDDQPFAVFKTSDDLNARLARAEKSAQEKLAKDAGFESAEAMAAAAKKAKEAEEAAKTEAQKQAEALAAAQKKADEEAAKATDAKTKADAKVIKAEARSLARLAGAVDVEDVLKLMDSTNVKIDEEGNVTGAQEAIDALKAAKPHLFGTAKPPAAPPVGGPLNPPKTPPANMVEASDDEFASTLAQYGMRPHSSTTIQTPKKG